MSRSGYTEDCEDTLAIGRWRAVIASATRGKRGQAFFRDLIAALDAMPEKELISEELQDADGEVCALGALGRARGVNLASLNTEDYDALGAEFNIAHQLAQEVMYQNDEYVHDTKWVEVDICGPVRPHWPDWGKTSKEVMVPNEAAAKERWAHVRKWAQDQLVKSDTAETGK